MKNKQTSIKIAPEDLRVADEAARVAVLEQGSKEAQPATPKEPKTRTVFRLGVHVPNPEAIERLMELNERGGMTSAPGS